MAELIKIPVIEFNTIIDFKVSGQFYTRIRNLLVSKTKDVSKEDLIKLFQKMKNEETPTTLFEEEVFVLLSLIGAIEKQANDTGKVTWKEIDPEKEQDLI